MNCMLFVLQFPMVLKLFDLREMCIVLPPKTKQLSLNNDDDYSISTTFFSKESYFHQHLLTLEYFDIEKQTEFILQYLWVNENASLEYIIEKVEQQIMHMNIHHNKSKVISNIVFNLNQVKRYANVMKKKDLDINEKFIIFGKNRYYSLKTKLNSVIKKGSLTKFCLQLNPDHQWFHSSQNMAMAKLKCENIQLEKFYTKYEQFLSDSENRFLLKIYDSRNSKDNDWHKRSTFKPISPSYTYNTSNKRGSLLEGDFEFEVAPNFDWALIRRKVCDVLGENVLENIEILLNNARRVDYSQAIGNLRRKCLIISNKKCDYFTWHIVKSDSSDVNQLFIVSFPVKFSSANQEVLIRYPTKSFIIQDLLKAALKQMKNPNIDSYEEMHIILSSEEDFGEKFTMIVKNDGTYLMNDRFTVPSDIDPFSNDLISFELRIKHVKTLVLRFTSSVQFKCNTNTENVEYLLTPKSATVKVTSDLSLQTILSNVRRHVKSMRLNYSCYFVSSFARKVIEIKKLHGRYDYYFPFIQFLESDPNAYIVVKCDSFSPGFGLHIS